MSEKTISLTKREQEIYNLLLQGTSPKEITYDLKISYGTVLGHQRNLYNKLDVHSINELLTKYSAKDYSKSVLTFSKSTPAVFTKWQLVEDKTGSRINILLKDEEIEQQHFTTYTISGMLSYINMSYTAAAAFPDPAAHEAMKNMKSFTFKVLGDGNIYDIQLMTTESRVEGGFNHYRKTQTTKKNEIITVTVNIDELTQVTTYGKKVPFIQNNIECFQIQPFSTGEFSLKIWDIRFNQ